MHVAIDHHSRLAFAAMYPDQTERSFTHFLAIAVPWYEGLGIGIRRVLTDNDQCYKANRFAHARGQVGLKHRRTRPYTHAPTVKQNASSRPPATSGPTHAPSRTQQKEAPSFRLGPISTTGIDPTPASTDNHPSAEQGSMTTTS
jgi:Integrase core domain